MSRIAVLFLRLTAILVGYAVAVLAGVAFSFIIVMGISTGEHTPLSFEWIASGLTFLPVVMIIAASLAFLPALAMIAITEFWGKRDWLFHALAGAAVSLMAAGISPLPSWFFSEPGRMRVRYAMDPGFILILAASGMIGGMVYWLVAGRRAGLWRESAASISSHSQRNKN